MASFNKTKVTAFLELISVPSLMAYVYLKKNYIIDENDPLSDSNKIQLGYSRTNVAVYSKINFKVEICSALYIFNSYPTLYSPS